MRGGSRLAQAEAEQAMDPSIRELRIEDLKAKIATCQQQCSALHKQSSSPSQTPAQIAEALRDQLETIEHCHNLRYMLDLHESDLPHSAEPDTPKP